MVPGEGEEVLIKGVEGERVGKRVCGLWGWNITDKEEKHEWSKMNARRLG